MKRVNVLTFCTWTSLGSILQAFGLTKTLESIGLESKLLLSEDENVFFVSRVTSLRSLLSRFFQVMVHRERRLSHHKRCNFIAQNLDVVTYCHYDDLTRIMSDNPDSCYLVGSDQIWHPERCYKHFFLEFVRNRKCISYAASMGKTEIPEENVGMFRSMLERLDHISVREMQCKEALQPLTEKEIEVHIDPTFLLETDTWRKYEKEYPISQPFILLYMIYWDPACKEEICELKKRTGLPVYAICSGLSRVYADRKLFDVGVEEFLWLVDHAEYVITSSFHGVALSTIFNKKFSAVVNPASPSRIQNLMSVLNIPEVSINQLDKTDRFDYDIILERMAEERKKGMEYLKEVISE